MNWFQSIASAIAIFLCIAGGMLGLAFLATLNQTATYIGMLTVFSIAFVTVVAWSLHIPSRQRKRTI